MLQYLTAGESHGKYLSAILANIPSGLKIDPNLIQEELARRQQGYGRGGRQKIEADRVQMTAGVIRGISTGAPIAFLLENRDASIDKMPDLSRPRPGHADLAGALKYDQGIRPVLERASARETAMRVAVGAVCKIFLKEFGIQVVGHVLRIGKASVVGERKETIDSIQKKAKHSPVFCICKKAEKAMMKAIDETRRQKNTLGGQYEIRAGRMPIGLGSYAHYEKKLDGRLAQVLMSQQSVKAVEIGRGVELGSLLGSEAHDEIFYDSKRGYYHKTNRAGGLEGGTTNGEDIAVKVTMKPISTLGQPLTSIDMKTKKEEKADFERSDFCAVPAGSVIGEALVACVLAEAFLEKFGGDSMREIRRNFEGYLKQIKG
ncbi:MAG: chorismate synthase [Candidatus Omnitrophica bacterium]|nr:chorismate synthase [Candidatus Omnitrophota bacterium]